MSESARYEIRVLIGPCEEYEAAMFMDAMLDGIVDVDDRHGAVFSLHAWEESDTEAVKT